MSWSAGKPRVHLCGMSKRGSVDRERGDKKTYIDASAFCHSPVSRMVKRAIDIFLGVVLFLFAIPLYVLIACLVKLDSKGPVLFFQERIGWQGKSFRIIKFRTMHVDARERFDASTPGVTDFDRQWQECFERSHDPRITRIGKMLRRHSLDELPQLVNVIRGQMSLVGPRPVVARELDVYYRGKSRFYIQVRPGMTGLWQVSGRCTTTYRQRVALDTCYVKTWNMWKDCVILMKTIRVVWTCEGAF